jgi:hypothetical protein
VKKREEEDLTGWFWLWTHPFETIVAGGALLYMFFKITVKHMFKPKKKKGGKDA